MFFFFSSRRRHTRCSRDWSSDVCSSDLVGDPGEQSCFEHECADNAQRGPSPGSAGPRSLAGVSTMKMRHSQQIGRASCRERVEISVVGVSLNKKVRDTGEAVTHIYLVKV